MHGGGTIPLPNTNIFFFASGMLMGWSVCSPWKGKGGEESQCQMNRRQEELGVRRWGGQIVG